MISRATWDIPAALVAILVIFGLHNFAYLYFFDFNEGVSAAPAVIKGAKDMVYLSVLAALLAITPWTSLVRYREQLAFLPFAAALVIVSIAHAPQTGLMTQVWENLKNIAIYIPVYMIAFTLGSRTATALFAIIVGAAVFQGVFSFAFYAWGGVLWVDKVFAGLVGNPNSFALLLNLAASVLLAYLPVSRRGVLVLTYLTLSFVTMSLAGTESASQMVILALLLTMASAINRKYWPRYIIASVVIVLSIVSRPGALANSAYALGAQTIQSTQTSVSVSTRLEQAQRALGILGESPISALLGSFKAKDVVGMDGQVWHFLYYGGLLTLLTFAVPAIVIYWKSITSLWRGPDTAGVAMHLMLTAFGVTLLASRALMYFPFNLLFFLICGLAAASLSRTSAARDDATSAAGYRSRQ